MTGYDAGVGYDAGIGYNGVTPDANPSSNVRLEIAFATNPDDAVPAWVDMTTRCHLPSGISVDRGRANEFDTTQPGRLTCTLENIDGALTPDNSSGTYYPNVLPQRRIRLTYRDPGNLGQGNMLAAEDASFEGGTVGAWGSTYFGAPASVTLSNNTSHPSSGTKGVLIGWPTAAAGCAAVLFTPPLVIGRRYTFRVVIWNAVGTPNVNFGDIFGVISAGALSTTTGAFETLTFSWVATTTQPVFGIKSNSATTVGQQTWFDAVMIDETPLGVSLGGFTTTPPAILPRFDGYVNEWPVEWPDGGDTYSRSTVTAADLLSRLENRQKLRSVVDETMALDAGLRYHFPLGEPDGSTVVTSTAGSEPAVLAVTQMGSGGTLAFAAGTGAPTDGLSAPVFTPASSTNGLYLDGALPTPVGTASQTVVLEASWATRAFNVTIATLYDGSGNFLSIEMSSATLAVVRGTNVIGATQLAATDGFTHYDDGRTHHAVATLSVSGSTVTLALEVDGAAALTSTGSTTDFPMVPWTRLAIGAQRSFSEFLMDGTVNHVAVYGAALGAGRAAEHRLALTTGFAGERSDQRLARICTWIGLPAARCNFDVGTTTNVGHIDCTGISPLEYMRKVELTEAGLLFAGADGRLTFYNRARSYAATAPALTLPADPGIEPTARLAQNLQLVINDITGSRVNGATVRMVDQPSIDAYGPLTETIELVAGTDADVAYAVGWRLNMSRKPLTRFTSLDLDAYTDQTYSPQILTLVDIGARVQITGMPAQAPASTLRQTVQGYSESITDSGWAISVNATPYDQMVGLILDDSTNGTTDSINHLVY